LVDLHQITAVCLANALLIHSPKIKFSIVLRFNLLTYLGS